MNTGLQPATPANSGPFTIHIDGRPNDPAAVLDGEPLRKMTALRQKAIDLHLQVPTFETVQELQQVKQGHANRIADLTRHRSEGGFGQPDDAGSVVAERKKLQRADAELRRVTTLKEIRSTKWNEAAQLERFVTDWLMDGGIPGGCKIEAVEDAPITDLLKKGENIADAVERYRHRLRELAADLHRVKSAPWPSSVAKAKAKAQIDALADAAAPDCDRAIEHGLPVSFATMMQTAMVRGVETPALSVTEAIDTFGLMMFLFKDQVLQKINAALDEAADDSNALSEREREEAIAQITFDSLVCERAECSLIWSADAKGDVIGFRSTTSPQAVLGLTLTTRTPVSERGSSLEHALSIIGVR